MITTDVNVAKLCTREKKLRAQWAHKSKPDLFCHQTANTKYNYKIQINIANKIQEQNTKIKNTTCKIKHEPTELCCRWVEWTSDAFSCFKYKVTFVKGKTSNTTLSLPGEMNIFQIPLNGRKDCGDSAQSCPRGWIRIV